MSAASCTERAWACLSGVRLTGVPVPESQYCPNVFTMVGTFCASTSRRFSSAEAALAS